MQSDPIKVPVSDLPPAVKFKRFIEAAMALDPTLTLDEVAAAIGCSRASITQWREGADVPARLAFRKAIEIWTAGKVRAEEWGTPKERRALRRVKAFPMADQIEV